MAASRSPSWCDPGRSTNRIRVRRRPGRLAGELPAPAIVRDQPFVARQSAGPTRSMMRHHLLGFGRRFDYVERTHPGPMDDAIVFGVVEPRGKMHRAHVVPDQHIVVTPLVAIDE